MHGNEIQERGFALRVPERLERDYGIDGHWS
jgi:hypothetical protein